MKLHLHVWELGEDPDRMLPDPIEEVDLELTGIYADFGDDSDHLQFSGTVQGKHLEIRVFLKDLPQMCQESWLEQLRQEKAPD